MMKKIILMLAVAAFGTLSAPAFAEEETINCIEAELQIGKLKDSLRMMKVQYDYTPDAMKAQMREIMADLQKSIDDLQAQVDEKCSTYPDDN
ncbi:hypothetical protein [Bdellovibrio reynosensis]|uniref:Uncharacterized protein n=1 Tax=Bdellovibrio reynosensis TaxID=2835041 RepID=A0ABY4CE57_9BACT|nr:hypothetical protein [Bdellovibrio reynosensis]UOF02036.1 hypothetical protein MNR06_03590 [Bdellovibrio reynosensis]